MTTSAVPAWTLLEPGVRRSASFPIAYGWLSFLLRGGADPARATLVRDHDGAVLRRQAGGPDPAPVRVTWDTAAHRGEQVHLEVAGGADGLDGLLLGDRITDDTGLTPVRIGLDNQPAPGSGTDAERYAADPLRPQFHYTPYRGWLNDPVGLIHWGGRHHLFSQSHPDEPRWAAMHWAHATGADPVRWRNAPIALTPPPKATPTDDSGIFSGSAVDHGGVLTLVYTIFTDVSAHPGAPAEGVGIATSTDGVTFTPVPGPVLAAPPAGSAAGFRDPRVFRDPTDGQWSMVVGSGDGGRGSVQLYRSADLRRWTHRGVLFAGDGRTGPMWECPDLFPIGADWVLLVSVLDQVHYWVGSYDGERFTPATGGVLDAGPAFYAAQHYTDAAGRPLLIGWMGRWEVHEPTALNGWAGAQSITRELFVRADGGLGCRPVPELATLHSGPDEAPPGPLAAGPDRLALPGGDTLDIELTLDLARGSADTVTVAVRESAAEATTVHYDRARAELTLDTTRSGYGTGGRHPVAVRPGPDGGLRLRLLVDRSAIEVFAGTGEALTARVFPRYAESTGVGVTATGGTVPLSASVHRMSSAWA